MIVFVNYHFFTSRWLREKIRDIAVFFGTIEFISEVVLVYILLSMMGVK